jgi:hypothetical protein
MMNRTVKVISVILVFSIVAVAGLMTVCKFTENIVPEESELAKYPKFNPFLIGRNGFRGINHNLDTNYYSFAYPVTFETAGDYFSAVDRQARQENWEIVLTENDKRVYRRKSNSTQRQITLIKLL